MLLIIDNYDSFTYNLVQYFGELGAEMKIVRNDALTVDEVKALKPERICISPGPCTPNEAGISCELIEKLGATTASASFVVDLPELGGLQKLRALGIRADALCAFEGR